MPLNTDAVTLPKLLKAAGYDTACIGKWHLDGHGSRSAFIPRERRQGFEYWKVLECTHSYNNSIYYGDTPEKRAWTGYDAIAQTRNAQDYLRRRSKADKPFLLWLAWGPPHNPYATAPGRYRAMYSPRSVIVRQNVPAADENLAREELAGYYAHCSALDDCVGDLMQTLDETGLASGTIVVFTSDHGDMLWSQDRQRKQWPWEESVRIPLLMRIPQTMKIAPGRRDATINTEDIMPTLLNLCGQPVPRSRGGAGFSDAMRGRATRPAVSRLCDASRPSENFRASTAGANRAVRSSHYTYVCDLNGPWLLYDNQADPYQLHNLVNEAAHATLLAELGGILKNKLAEQHDEFLSGPEYIKKWGYVVDADETAPFTP